MKRKQPTGKVANTRGTISRRALRRILLQRIRYEQACLAADDPNGNCAAWHRGAISECESLLAQFAPAGKLK